MIIYAYPEMIISTIITLTELSSISKHDHRKDRDKPIVIEQEYADEISAIASGKNKIHRIKEAVC